MASISKLPNGRRRICWLDGTAHRSLRLGKCSAARAQGVLLHVERLLEAKGLGQSIQSDTLQWLQSIDTRLRNRLVNANLVTDRTVAPTVKELADSYIDRRSDLRYHSIKNFKQARLTLIAHFSAARTIDTVTKADASDYRRYLAGLGLAEATISTNIKKSRQMFTDAVDRELIPSNPFQKIKAGSQKNRERLFFIDRPTVQKILDNLPDAEWRLIVALSRFGGLRCPSEHLELTWGDVDWAGGKLRVPSPKTEHQGKPFRLIPLFPELREHLQVVFDQAASGSLHVIARMRKQGGRVNWRTHLMRVIERAGLKPWPRLFHNLRASRQTELEERFPGHVVCEWIGNTEAVAKAHYLQVTDDHFARAVDPGAAQKAAQKTAETPRNEQKGDRSATGANAGISGRCDTIRDAAETVKWPLSESNRYSLAGNGF